MARRATCHAEPCPALWRAVSRDGSRHRRVWPPLSPPRRGRARAQSDLFCCASQASKGIVQERVQGPGPGAFLPRETRWGRDAGPRGPRGPRGLLSGHSPASVQGSTRWPHWAPVLRVEDRWLKSWCPSGDVVTRVTSLPRVDLIKQIVPVSRLRFICLLILTCLHKSSHGAEPPFRLR